MQGGGDAGQHAAAAEGRDDRVEAAAAAGGREGRGGGGDLVFHLERERALAEDDVRVVVGGDEARVGGADDVGDDGFALGGRAAGENDVRAVGARGGDFGRGRDGRHDDVGGDMAPVGGEGEGLGVVSWRWGGVRGDKGEGGGGIRTGAVRHDAIFELLVAESRESVGCAADFERADGLEVFTFEEEVYLWVAGGLAFEGSADQGGRRLRG